MAQAVLIIPHTVAQGPHGIDTWTLKDSYALNYKSGNRMLIILEAPTVLGFELEGYLGPKGTSTRNLCQLLFVDPAGDIPSCQTSLNLQLCPKRVNNIQVLVPLTT